VIHALLHHGNSPFSSILLLLCQLNDQEQELKADKARARADKARARADVECFRHTSKRTQDYARAREITDKARDHVFSFCVFLLLLLLGHLADKARAAHHANHTTCGSFYKRCNSTTATTHSTPRNIAKTQGYGTTP